MKKVYFKVVLDSTIYFVPAEHEVNYKDSLAHEYLLAADIAIKNGAIIKNRDGVLSNNKN